MKMPAFQFYPADWRKDPGVQALDYFTRGVWFEMLCLMHESEERGVLMLNGRPMPEEALAQLIHLDNQILTKALTKILDFGVASRREQDGAILCRRMVRDDKVCRVRRECGKQGGNPNLVNQNSTKAQPNSKANGNQGSNQKPTPSSSSSSSTTVKSRKVSKPANDQEWIASLKTNEAYRGIDIDIELGKAKAWIDIHRGRVFSQAFFLRWLNKAEKNMLLGLEAEEAAKLASYTPEQREILRHQIGLVD